MAVKTPKIRRIITLERGTCCEIAGRHMVEKFQFNPVPHFVMQPSFWEGFKWMRANATEDDIFLLPHVNEVCQTVTLLDGFTWDQSLLFWLPNPKLYLA